MNHSKAITLRVGYLRRRLMATEIRFNQSYKNLLRAEIKVVQASGIVNLDKMFLKLRKLGYTYTEKKLSSEGVYHVWGQRSGKKIFGVVDPSGESMMVMMPDKRTVTYITIPDGKSYMNTNDTFLTALLHPNVDD